MSLLEQEQADRISTKTGEHRNEIVERLILQAKQQEARPECDRGAAGPIRSLSQ